MQLREDLVSLRRRSAALVAVAFLSLGALHLRLVQLQLVDGAEWRRLAENNRLRRLPVVSSRGRIYDRRGVVLADNIPTWDLLLFPDEARDLDETALFLARLGVADATSIHQRLRTHRSDPLAPLLVGEDLSWTQVAATRAHQSDHPELSVISGFRRHYPLASTTAHAVGYLRLVSQEEIDRSTDLDPNTLVGASGVEALQNPSLSGRDGARWVVVNAIGQQLGVVQELASSSGQDLTVALDAGLQRVAAEAMGDESGAVVALDIASGAVRVLYSAPSFDANVFVGRLTTLQWRELASDPRHPLQNRCLQGMYPPGSTIKPILALAGLSEAKIPPDWGVYCSGSIMLHSHPFRCWRRGGHGRVDLVRSLEASCDVFYYLLGQRLGIDGMARWLRRFGFGEASGIGIPTEAAGLVGTPQWSRRVRKTPWYPGDAVSVSIGQGPLLVTALQLARAFAALANGGDLVQPFLVEHEEGKERDPRVSVVLQAEYLNSVREGLRRAVHGSEGTARVLAPLPVAGKTGTAQVARLQEGVDVKDLERHLRHHAWFVGWAPVAEPRLVVAVLVEHGGGGGSVAAPVALRVFAAALDPGAE